MLRERFVKHAATLDAATRKAILDKMREYGRSIARGALPPVSARPQKRREQAA